jgi:hypothetical protein
MLILVHGEAEQVGSMVILNLYTGGAQYESQPH